MVRKMLGMVYREVRGLHQAAYVLALFAIGSQLLALVRDRLLAHQFGAGAELDMYYAAFRIPDLLFVLFASTLSVYVLIPFVSKTTDDGVKRGSELLSQVFTIFLAFYSAVAVGLYFAMPQLSLWLFPGIEDQTMLVLLSRLLLLQPFLLGISSLFGVVTQIGHRFVLYAVSPIVYNIGIIVGIAGLYPFIGLPGLAVGVVFGAWLHLMVQWPFVRQSEYRLGLAAFFDLKKLSEILALSIPRALTLSMQQIVMLALFGFASAMAVGSVSVFQFAYNLFSVPLAIIGVSYSVAAFPVMSELWGKGKRDEFNLHIVTALRHIIFWAVPAIVLIIVLRAQLVRVVLGSGAFDWSDTRLTAAVLAVLMVSLLAHAVSLVAVRAFYAGGRTLVPFMVTAFGSVLALAFSYVSYLIYMADERLAGYVSSVMRLGGVEGSEVLALAFGYAFAVILQSIVLVGLLVVDFRVPLLSSWRSLGRAVPAALVGGLFAYVALNFTVEGVEQERLIGILIQGFLAGAAGIFGSAMTYTWSRSPELQEIYSSFQKKILKTDVVAPQEEVLGN
jgi:putative peptidoglycan lipid II flippase